MSNGRLDGSIWDENQWEHHLNEIERKSEQLRRFILSDPLGVTPRWVQLLSENNDKEGAVDAYIEEELLIDDAYFPDEDELDLDGDESDEEDDFFFRTRSGSERQNSLDGIDFGDDDSDEWDDEEDDFDDFEDGEEWKTLSEEYSLTNHGSIDNFKLYIDSKKVTVQILEWAESAELQETDSSLKSANKRVTAVNDFIEETLKISAKVAGGYTCGFDLDYLGGNIAYTKKALLTANNALDRLQRLKPLGIIPAPVYSEFHASLFELRNEIGLHIQVLREMFRLGME